MGYFSNGSEGQDYWEAMCSRCVHDTNNDCPIWGLHLALNYTECNKPDSILNQFIPRDAEGNNGDCKMFIEKK